MLQEFIQGQDTLNDEVGSWNRLGRQKGQLLPIKLMRACINPQVAFETVTPFFRQTGADMNRE